jgi:hypothetical protein
LSERSPASGDVVASLPGRYGIAPRWQGVSIQHLKENLAAAHISLTQDEVGVITGLARERELILDDQESSIRFEPENADGKARGGRVRRRR